MSPASSFACARLVDGVPCTARATVEASAAAVARVRLALAGWQITDAGALCPEHAAHVSYPAHRVAVPQGDVPDPVRRPLAAAYRSPVTGRLPVVRLLDDGEDQCQRCEDGDHQLCHKQACRCTATVACGGRS